MLSWGSSKRWMWVRDGSRVRGSTGNVVSWKRGESRSFWSSSLCGAECWSLLLRARNSGTRRGISCTLKWPLRIHCIEWRQVRAAAWRSFGVGLSRRVSSALICLPRSYPALIRTQRTRTYVDFDSKIHRGESIHCISPTRTRTIQRSKRTPLTAISLISISLHQSKDRREFLYKLRFPRCCCYCCSPSTWPTRGTVRVRLAMWNHSGTSPTRLGVISAQTPICSIEVNS